MITRISTESILEEREADEYPLFLSGYVAGSRISLPSTTHALEYGPFERAIIVQKIIVGDVCLCLLLVLGFQWSTSIC